MELHFVTDDKIAETSSKGNQENGMIMILTVGISWISSDMKPSANVLYQQCLNTAT